MRLRKVKNAYEALLLNDRHFIDEPEKNKGNWSKEFNNSNPIQIEIGCGKGRFITEMARLYPDINFIGIEKYESVLVRASDLSKKTELNNLRLIWFDAQSLTDVFALKEVSLIYLNFSDPWPKKKHHKRRLTSPLFLEIYKNILTDDGKIYQKTDNEELFSFSLEMFNESGFTLSNVTKDLHNSKIDFINVMTEFEERFSKNGPIYRLEATKK